MRFSLLTLVLLTIWLGLGALVVLRSNAWEPTDAVFPELEFPSPLIDSENPVSWNSPDGTRRSQCDQSIYLRQKKPSVELYDFGFYDQAHGTDWLLNHNSDRPAHVVAGFVDDDHIILTIFEHDGNLARIWRRKFPEWWWGHFYRPEVWALVVLTGAWGFLAVRRRLMWR